MFSGEDTYDEHKDEYRERDQEEVEAEREEPSTKYKISNLITLFNKSNISLQAIFTYQKRVMMLLIVHGSFNYVLYIPSKYEMYIDRNLGIATYDMNDDDEEPNEQDTLFYNRLPIESLRRVRNSKAKSLARFLPLVEESPIKIAYLDEYFVSYISRSNEVDSLIFMSPFKGSGYFLMTDLEFFFKNIHKLQEEFGRFERALNDAVYDRLTTELDSARHAINKAKDMLNRIHPKETKQKFTGMVSKLNKYLTIDKHREKARKWLLQVRNNNLNKMFEIEHVTYVMKEFK